jgi:hypothetical protein
MPAYSSAWLYVFTKEYPMKIVLFLMIAFSIQAQAQELTPAEFTKVFVAAVNAQIKVGNAALTEEYKGREIEYPKFYCPKLDKRQVTLITQTASIPDITVGEFREQILNDLKCFQQLWPDLERTNIWDSIFNTAALVKDSVLLHDSFDALSTSGYARDYESLLQFPYK